MFERIATFINQYVTENVTLANLLILCGIALVSVAAYYITKLLLGIVERVILRSPTDWDDDLLNGRMMRAISQLTPALAVNWLLPGFFATEDGGELHWLSALTSLYILWTAIYIVVIFINNLYDAFVKRPPLKAYAVKGIFQMVKIVCICIGIIIGMSIIIGKTPTAILTALGASAAVLMLVFQDIILGLVASIQLTANKMLQRGDWIEDRTHDINGEVLEVTLTAVKVQNWDNSVSTVPPYSLLKGSFRNYKPMQDSGGRRVERAIYIDVNTVRFCTPGELADLEANGWLDGLGIDAAAKVVNLHLLRRYLEHYLESDARVNHNMLTMVRQLDPTPSGLPLELYFFLNTVVWKEFEMTQADIFDHVYAIVAKFGLSIFQTPAGTDISKIK